MNTLFQIETDRVMLTWSKARGKEPVPILGNKTTVGRLVIQKRRNGLQFGKNTWRSYVPEAVSTDPEQVVGPLIYEETDYQLYLRSKSDARIEVFHRDPSIRRDLNEEEGGRVIHGCVNFGSQVGRCEFSVRVNNEPEFDFEIEVFPTKLDYASDYAELLAEVQRIMTGLALEYLRSTFQLGLKAHVPQPTHIEWLTLLQHVVDDLEHALHQVAQRPIRGLTRAPIMVRAEHIKRIDSAVRSVVRRGAGSGRLMQLNGVIAVRQYLQERRARPTLDTPEHRWLAAQLEQIRRKLGDLRQQESVREKSERRNQALLELDQLKARIARLSRLEPIACAEGEPPSGFASLQLLAASGYREAYQHCIILSLGLRIEGGPLQLSVKDLSLLYEYWCYLALLRLTSEETGKSIRLRDLFIIRQQGLQVLLQKGRESCIHFDTSTERKVRVTYNPRFQGDSVLIPQQPDMVITFEEPNWSTLHLILDAKYRVDGSPEYVEQYTSPGPPVEAINVLHRYRDAILEHDNEEWANERPKRTVVQAAAVFPFREPTPEAFRSSRLWQSLDRLGIGAIPLLPGHTDYLREWLRSALRQGGWSLADRAIDHRARQRAHDWRIAASEPVLVGVLRDDNEIRHLDWIREHRLYYMPLLKTQRRQYAAKWVAIYSSEALHKPGSVTHYAPVDFIEVVSRGKISTPWKASRDSTELQVLYHLGNLKEMEQPVENREVNGRRQRFSQHRWTSRLALGRAKTLEELLLETEPEWRLYEQLQACGINFYLDPRQPVLGDKDNPEWRVWFVVPDKQLRIRYSGSSGFVVKHYSGVQRSLLRLEEVLEMLYPTTYATPGKQL